MSSRPNEDAPADRGGGYPSSSQVSWFAVYQFAERWASSHDLDLLVHDLVIPGTPAWCSLSDDDARKFLSLILGGIREALSLEVDQEHRADASRAIAEATNWSTQANRLRGRSGPAYIERKGVA